MSTIPFSWPFADAESAERFSRFRAGILGGDYSIRHLALCSPPGAPGMELARWLGDLAGDWHKMLGSLLLGTDDEVGIVLPFEELRLPGGRGRLHIVSMALLEIDDMERLASLITPFSTDPKSWVVSVDEGVALPVRQEDKDLDCQVQLLGRGLADFPG